MEQTGDFNKFTRRSYFHIGFYFWITGIRYNNPETSFDTAVDKFFKYFKVDEKRYSKQSMRREYQRIQQDFDREEIEEFKKQFSTDGQAKKTAPVDNGAKDSK